MTESVAVSAPEAAAGPEASWDGEAGPGFVLLFDAPPNAEVAVAYGQLCDDVSDDCERVVGASCAVRWASLPVASQRGPAGADERASQQAEALLASLSQSGHSPLFLLPCSFDFGASSKAWLTQLVRAQQRSFAHRALHYDAPSPAHPLLLQAFADRACQALGQLEGAAPASVGLLLVANGAGDPHTRAESYQLMRLLWEQLGAARGEVAFVRHASNALPERLAACASTGLGWLAVGQYLWPGGGYEYARLILADSVGQFGLRAQLSEPAADHPNLRAWLAQRCLALFRSKRERLQSRAPSRKYVEMGPPRVFGPGRSCPLPDAVGLDPALHFGEPGGAPAVVAELPSAQGLGQLLRWVGVPQARCIIKPTWHGYATGTYTDPVALDALLAAVEPRATVVEGHTTSRNTGNAEFDWEREARAQRRWIAEQEQQYLAKTGLLESLRQGRASYVNVTEAVWDGQCAPPTRVAEVLEGKGVRLRFEELLESVPQALFDRRGAPMFSFARFKGPTRLSISNLFGLLPEPLRAAWHGPSIVHFAQVCCDLARLYGALFELYGVVESLSVAVRWDRKGLYRSRWGHYDLLPRPGVVCVSRGLAGADVLAARLQGQDVTRSAFFDVVGAELGFAPRLASAPLPASLLKRFL